MNVPMPGDVFSVRDRRFYVLRRTPSGATVLQVDSGSGYGTPATGSVPPLAQRESGSRWAPVPRRADLTVDGVSYVDLGGQVFARVEES